MRYDLAFFLCCCKSFLGSATQTPGEEDFYELLGIERDATPEEIKRAYKRKSLQMHPDKLAQRGQQVTDADQARFQRMKEAYETLSDPHKRETYDTIGERGMKWLEEPFSLDPQEMARNFANSSTVDRSKIFGIFVGIAIAVFLLPVLVCLQVDGQLGPAPWTAVLTPLWVWNAFILFYHARVIAMGPISRPENIPEADWVDPLPMSKRIFSLFRFSLIIVFEILASLRLDNIVSWSWVQVFIPIYVWEATTLYKKVPLARMKIVTVDDLETALGKPFAEFTQAEKDLISRRYSVVPSVDSPEFEAAHKLKSRARQDVIKVGFRVVFLLFLITELDTDVGWNWWFIFSPFWIMSFCICCGSYQGFAEAQAALAEQDPDFMSMTGKKTDGNDGDEENQTLNGEGSYGAMGPDGGDSGSKASKKLTEEETNELKAQLMQSGYRMVSSCCSQAFILLIVGLFVGKIQGADYASMWVISPLLLVAGVILLCLGCTIFCITEVSDDDIFDPSRSTTNQQSTTTDYSPPNVPVPNPTSKDKQEATQPPKATWDPEKGQVWNDNRDKNSQDPNILIPVSPPSETATPSQSLNADNNNTFSSTLETNEQPVDLLDDNDPPTTDTKVATNTSNDIHELD
mmetsp:Transcript_63925/g.75678  ORF Transcript_63925/g.75678 Transcript_63925/m.75678 type:complete len:630 (+) Transcript_63925:182-2071(+)|eukprot:CAMPEP_0172498472 /NCGR_PEP_ID=MMETSP1066-20121228/113453_1 /TAXON_ID=671091 /ORGANISM="Coscinodiscus wailesii, Strain CCMP2513" /LENGTH=629 /DNA_ID=CAMNT_0013271753 /DNA_START=182 /DNA_END=2071 /DNA_ORIENTATION=+